MACLPTGAPGATPAATVATDIQRTFTGVRVGLLVGVGSGTLSSANDIRVGDIVVSEPTGDTGGVIQYERMAADDGNDNEQRQNSNSTEGDGGRSGGRFRRARHLNAPLRVLLTALAGLQAQHAMTGSRASDFLVEAAQKYLRMRSHFIEPAAVGSSNCKRSLADGGRGGSGGSSREWKPTDRLYAAAYQHVADAGDSVCGCCDARMLVQRRKHKFAGPTVHYGVIASGDVDFACGVARDEAKAALGALCFEREAAGLMDNFPCLVIRGICDYADSHKSALWRDFATTSAAACTKELLEMMPPQEVQETATIIKMMNEGKMLSLRKLRGLPVFSAFTYAHWYIQFR
jgi:hypothetical protein